MEPLNYKVLTKFLFKIPHFKAIELIIREEAPLISIKYNLSIYLHQIFLKTEMIKISLKVAINYYNKALILIY